MDRNTLKNQVFNDDALLKNLNLFGENISTSTNLISLSMLNKEEDKKLSPNQIVEKSKRYN